MALTPLRWAAAAASGCLVALALVLSIPFPRRDWRQYARTALENRASMLDRASTAAARRLRTSQVIDSVERALGQLPRGTASRVVIDRSFRRRDYLASVITGRLRRAASPVDVVLLLDTTTSLRGRRAYSFNKITHILPRSPGERCVSLARYDSTSGRTRRYAVDNEHVLSEVLGPCAFYAAFGHPGAGIDRWLRGDAWAFGTHALGVVSPVFAMGRSASNQPVAYDWMDRNVPWRFDAGFPMRRFVSTNAYACIAGDRDACLGVVLAPKVLQRRLGMEHVDPNGSISRALVNDLYWANNELGVASHDLLSDMVASVGDDRFRRFWTSDEPPREAFAAATGQDLGEWIAQWATRRYGEFSRGPGVSFDTAGVSLVVAFLAIAAATVASRRRQVA